MLKAGTKLRDLYQIERVVGKGGMGGVYLATYLGNGGGSVAIKEMQMHLFKDEETQVAAIRQFRAEAGILYSLRHPALPRMYDFFNLDEAWFLVMDFIDGLTMREVLQTKGPIQESMARRLLIEMAEVLRYMHNHKPPVIFRDVKPGNIMLDADGHFKLIDFGISKLLSSGDQTTSFIRGAGTRGFASIEQYSGGTDERSDIYSLGATIYCLLTGQTPPPAPSLALGVEHLVPLMEVCPGLHADFAQIVFDMMNLAPAHRPHIPDILQRATALPPVGDEPVRPAPVEMAVDEAPTLRIPPPVSWTMLLVGESGPVADWERAAGRYHRRFRSEPVISDAIACLDEHPTSAVIVRGLPDRDLVLKCQELQIPFFVVAGEASTATRLELVQFGCTAYFHQPVPISRVVEAVEAVLRSYYRRAPVVMVLDDDPIALTAMQVSFSTFGLVVHCLEDPTQFWETVDAVYPDFLILDIEMPGASGLDICRSVRADARWRPLPILILTSSNDADSIDAVYKAGADDYASKPILVADLATRIKNRLRRIDYLTPPTIAAEAPQPAGRWRKLSKA